MSEYKEEDFLLLSGIQHYIFCKRQWALIHIEQQWSENFLTVQGELMHEKAHDGYSGEKRNNIIISRGMPIHSYSLGIRGVCDVVEFLKTKEGISLFGKDGLYTVFPVEYKRGSPKEDESDILQLVTQAMCLEEMLCCSINAGYLYYGKIRRRVKVTIDNVLRDKVKATFEEMHQLFNRGYTPKVKPSKACKACSLRDICIPKLYSSKSAKQYIMDSIREE
jgi:CRISPR-associated exonuclease Cas4